MNLNYLTDPNKQFQAPNGLNNVAGFLRVYYDGTDDRATTYKNFIGTLNPADIPLDNNGRAVVIADSEKVYRVEVYSASGALLWTQHPVFPQGGGGSEYDGDVSDATATFTKDDGDTSEMSSGSTLKVLFTKISKFFAGLKRVAFTGSYNDLSDRPSVPAAQVQSDWNQTNSQAVDFIKNKPSLASVATSGNYADLNNKPTIPNPQVQSDWSQSNSNAVDYIKNKPSIPDVSGKLNINGDNATAAGSRAIVDKISYNDDPTIDDNSKILQKNGVGWEQVNLSAYLEYLAGKNFPFMESVSTTVMKTVASGEENAITLGNVNFPTRKTRSAIAIVTVQFKVDSNYGQIDLSQVSRDARFSLEDPGSSYDVPMAIVKDFDDLKSCVTFQIPLSLAYYPSSLEAHVYSLNAPVGVSLRALVRITTLGTGQLYVNN